MDFLHSIFGISVLLALAYALGRWLTKASYTFPTRIVVAGMLLTFGIATLLLLFPPARQLFASLNEALQILEAATQHGMSFVFGYLAGGATPFETTQPNNGFILAFRALPLILVVSALSALLYHWRILPIIVHAVSHILQKIMGIRGTLGVGAAANIFVGMIEGPLLIQPYLKNMSRSELFALMTVGMATVAGTVMALYSAVLSHAIPDAIGHILTASMISVPAGLTIAMLMVPPEKEENIQDDIKPLAKPYTSSMDAIASGTNQGVQLLLNITAMLVVFLALIYLANTLLGLIPGSNTPWTLEGILGWLAAPLVWLIGVPWHEAQTAGMLLGEKTILNEFVAYLHLSSLTDTELSERSRLLMTYALCGFANLGSLGIMIGGLGALVPERRAEIIQLGGWSVVAGILTTLLTAAVVGLLI